MRIAFRNTAMPKEKTRTRAIYMSLIPAMSPIVALRAESIKKNLAAEQEYKSTFILALEHCISHEPESR